MPELGATARISPEVYENYLTSGQPDHSDSASGDRVLGDGRTEHRTEHRDDEPDREPAG
jgi:hypothetical protein